MKVSKLFFALCASLCAALASAQSVPNPSTPIVEGVVWTPAQWITAWESKVDLSQVGTTIPTSPISLSSSVIDGNLPVTKLNGGTSASNTTFWRGDGIWATPAGSGGGTVNEVAATAVSPICVTGSPITNSGTLTFGWCTGLTTHQFLGTGTSGTPAMLSISAADLPNLPVTNLNSGTAASSTTFWRGDGTWATPASSSFNPAVSQTITAPWTFEPPSSSSIPLTIISPTATEAFAINNNSDSAQFFFVEGATGDATINPSSGTPLAVNNPSAGAAVFITNSGTAAGVAVTGPAGSQVAGLVFGQVGQDSWILYEPASTSDFRINNGAGADALIIKSDGGITTPGQTDEGAGTINAAGLFVNGVAVGSGGTRQIGGMTNCSSGACTIQNNHGLSSIARTGVGTYTVSFTTAYAAAPVCVGSPFSSAASTTPIVNVTTPTTSAVGVTTALNLATADTGFSVICIGN
jgi:hypothetical protein